MRDFLNSALSSVVIESLSNVKSENDPFAEASNARWEELLDRALTPADLEIDPFELLFSYIVLDIFREDSDKRSLVEKWEETRSRIDSVINLKAEDLRKDAVELFNIRDSETIASFLLRVYGTPGQLDSTFTRGHLRKIDPTAALALDRLEQEFKKAQSNKSSSEGDLEELDQALTTKSTNGSEASFPPNERYSTHALPGEDAVRFIERVYGQAGYLTGEFTRADLRKIDPSAAKALDNWEQATKQRPKRRAPLNLPTLKEKNDRLLSQAPDQTPIAVKEHERLRSIARRRQTKLEK